MLPAPRLRDVLLIHYWIPAMGVLLCTLTIAALVWVFAVKLSAKEKEDERLFHAPENCRAYAEEPRSGGATCPRRSHRGRILKLDNGGALLVCECPNQPIANP